MKLTKEQVNEVIKWMETWEQLKGTAIPIRFKEDFTEHDSNTLLAASWQHQLCPKCFGEGTIAHYPQYTTGLMYRTCPVCNGAKTLIVPNCQPACDHAKGG